MGRPAGVSPAAEWRRWLPWVLCLLPVAIYALQAWDHRFIIDDGFINFRFVRQIEAGNGPVYNAGQRVEGFTSPAWLAALTVVDLLTPLRLEWISVFVSITFAVAGLTLAVLGSARLWRAVDPHAFLAPLGVLLPVALYPMWYFATSGLETGAVFGWLGWCLFLLAGWARGPDRLLSWRTAFVLGLGWIIRPELLLVTVALLTVVLVGERARPPRSVFAVLAAALALPTAYQIFRMGYYASLVSNTAYAKQAADAHWSRGWVYLRELVHDYALWVPVACIAIVAAVLVRRAFRSPDCRRIGLVVIGFLAGAALVTVYVVRVGGDYIHARLLLPPLFAACIPTAVMPLQRPRTVAIGILVVAVGWSCAAALTMRPQQLYRVTLDERHNLINVEDVIEQPTDEVKARYRNGRIFWERRRLADAPNPQLARPTVGMAFIGTTGYVLGPSYDILDALGLTDAVDARFRTGSRVSIAGHEKPLPAAWAAARLTAPGADVAAADFEVRGLGFPIEPLIPPRTGPAFRRQVAAARHALSCGGLAAFQDRSRDRLTPGRFVANLWGAISSASFSVPADPLEAEREFCGRRGH